MLPWYRRLYGVRTSLVDSGSIDPLRRNHSHPVVVSIFWGGCVLRSVTWLIGQNDLRL